MKRLFTVCIGILTFLLLTGCSPQESNATSFYYCRNPEQYQYFARDAVIRSEERDLLGHRDDIKYMVSLYLAGPLEEDLRSPFVKTTRLLSVDETDGSVFIELSDLGTALSDSEFTLACACLTLTCLDFVHCAGVTITSGSRSVTMNADSILLFDVLPSQGNTEG